MRSWIKIINPQDQADAAEPSLHGEGGALRQQKRVITGNISACLRGPVNWGAEKKTRIVDFLAGVCFFFVTFLACPRKVTQRRAPGENSSRHAQSSSVHFGPKCFTLGLNRLPKFSHGEAKRDILKAFALPKPPASHEQVRAHSMRCSIKIINPQDQADAAEPMFTWRGWSAATAEEGDNW